MSQTVELSPIGPHLARVFDGERLTTEVARGVMGPLTPGSLTLDIDNSRIEVHCLTAESAADLQRGEMLRRATRLARD